MNLQHVNIRAKPTTTKNQLIEPPKLVLPRRFTFQHSRPQHQRYASAIALPGSPWAVISHEHLQINVPAGQDRWLHAEEALRHDHELRARGVKLFDRFTNDLLALTRAIGLP